MIMVCYELHFLCDKTKWCVIHKTYPAHPLHSLLTKTNVLSCLHMALDIHALHSVRGNQGSQKRPGKSEQEEEIHL